MPHIQFLAQLPAAIEEKMEKSFTEYEVSQGIDLRDEKFSFLLKNDQDEVMAVLKGNATFPQICVEKLWVEPIHRCKSYGRQLLAVLEAHFQSRGFDHIHLVTFQFQAPEFYKKCGFTLEFVRKNRANSQLNTFFFVKYLSL